MGTGALPQRVERWLVDRQWGHLAGGLRADVPVHLTGNGGFSLLEQVLSAQEAPGSAPLPMTLLEAFIDAGLARGVVPGNREITAVALCAEYAQWEWMDALLARGFQVETPAWPAIAALGTGRVQRRAEAGWIEAATAHDRAGPEEASTGPDRPADATVVDLLPAGAVELSLEAAEARMAQETGPMRQALLSLLGAGADLEAPIEESCPPPELMPTLPHCRRGASPLVAALREGDAAFALALVGAGADCQSVFCVHAGSGMATIGVPLEWAMGAGLEDVVLAMLRQGAIATQVPCVSPDGQSLALRHILEAVVAPTADPQDPEANLMRAAWVRLLFEFVPDAERANVGRQALMRAAVANQVECVAALLDLGVPRDAATRTNGFQAIHQACLNGAEETIALLLERGARLSDTSRTGVSAAACLNDRPDLLARFGGQGVAGNVRMLRPRR